MKEYKLYHYGRYDYIISSDGDIIRKPCYINNGKSISLRKEKVLTGTLTKKGYRTFELDGKAHRIHRLVATLFIPNILNKPQVNHKDGNKLNNNVDNLEWCSNLENMQHAYRTGLQVNDFGVKARNFKYMIKCSEHSEWGELTASDMAKKISEYMDNVINIKACESNIRYRLSGYGLNFIKTNRKSGEQNVANQFI
jgi:hypothetical protein